MSLTTPQKSFVGLLLLAGVISIPVAMHYQSDGKLRSEIEELRQQNQELARLREQSEKERKTEAADLERLRQEHGELLRLRGQISTLRSRETEVAQLQAENRQLKTAAQKSTAAPNPPNAAPSNAPRQPAESWANVGFATPAAAFQTLNWAISHQDTNVFASGLIWSDDQSRARAEAAFAAAPDSVRSRYGSLEGLVSSSFMGIASPAGFRIVSQFDRGDTSLVVAEKDFANGTVKPDKVQLQNDGQAYRQVIPPGMAERLIQREITAPSTGK